VPEIERRGAAEDSSPSPATESYTPSATAWRCSSNPSAVSPGAPIISVSRWSSLAGSLR